MEGRRGAGLGVSAGPWEGAGGGACLVGLAIYIYFVLPIGLIITLFWQPVMRAESERAKASRALLPRIGGTKYYLGTTKYLTRGYSCDGVRVLHHFGNDAPPVSLNIYLFSRTSKFLRVSCSPFLDYEYELFKSERKTHKSSEHCPELSFSVRDGLGRVVFFSQEWGGILLSLSLIIEILLTVLLGLRFQILDLYRRNLLFIMTLYVVTLIEV